MLRPKKNSYKEFDNEKKFLRLKNSPPPPPPHNFSNGPSLSDVSFPEQVHGLELVSRVFSLLENEKLQLSCRSKNFSL